MLKPSSSCIGFGSLGSERAAMLQPSSSCIGFEASASAKLAADVLSASRALGAPSANYLKKSASSLYLGKTGSESNSRKEASSFRAALLEFADEYELLQADYAQLVSENQRLTRKSSMFFPDVRAKSMMRAAPPEFHIARKESPRQASPKSKNTGAITPTRSRNTEVQSSGSEKSPELHDCIQLEFDTEHLESAAEHAVAQERLVNDAIPLETDEGATFQGPGTSNSPSLWSPLGREVIPTGTSGSRRVNSTRSNETGVKSEGLKSAGSHLFNAASSVGSKASKSTMGSRGPRLSQLFPTWFDPGKQSNIKSLMEGDDSPIARMLTMPGVEGAYEYDERPGRCLLGPVSKARLCWDVVASLLLVCELWITPFELIFVPRSEVDFLQNFGYGITVFFALDIVLNFSTGYIQENKRVIMKRCAIVKNYLKTWFILDLAATLPVDLILASMEGDYFAAARLGKGSKMFRTFRYLKLIRAVRMLRTVKTYRGLLSHYETHWLLRKLFTPVLTVLLLMMFGHANGCLFAGMQPEWAESQTVAEGLLRYYDCFTYAYAKLIGFTADTYRSELHWLWTFDCLVASERLLLLVFLAYRLFLFALSMEEQARERTIHNNARQYLRGRNVSFRTQLEVLYSIQETAKAQNMQKHFRQLCSDELPMQLRRTISQELWSTKLMSLGLIMHIVHWNEDFVNELALLVIEEIFPSYACMFREGEAAIATYYVIEGELAVVSTMSPLAIPDFLTGMWLGEKALVNPLLRRAASVTTKCLTIVMTISANSFHDLLTYLGLMCQFQTFCSEQLWRGLCGRCGVLGDHFADTCPTILGYEVIQPVYSMKPEPGSEDWKPAPSNGPSTRASGMDQMMRAVKSVGWMEAPSSKSTKSVADKICDVMTNRPLFNRTESKNSHRPEVGSRKTQDLLRFLKRQKKEKLMPILKEISVECLEDLEVVDLNDLANKLELTEDDLKSLSQEAIVKFRETTARAVHEALFKNSPKNQYLVFLSHHKEGAGTEAALLRTELLRAIAQDPGSPAHSFDVPVFLDSEDLQNLCEVQERVAASHNLVVLLTYNVFSRPWVLVELVTARRAGLRILPVRVCKANNEFEMPTEDFYKSLADGKVLASESKKVLQDCGIEMVEVSKAIRQMCNRILIPYSPHRSEAVRQAEVGDLLKQCALKVRNPRTRGTDDSSEAPWGTAASAASFNAAMQPSSTRPSSRPSTMVSLLDDTSEHSADIAAFSDRRASTAVMASSTQQEDVENDFQEWASRLSAYSNRAI